MSLDDVPFSLAGRPKVVPLLAYVLLHRAAPLPRRAIAYALWPDQSEDEARANLRRHLNYLSALLPPSPPDRTWLCASGGTLQWNPAAELWLDVAEFERLAAAPNRRADALALYAGELLAEVDEEWLAPERARLQDLFRSTLAAHVASLRAAREYRPAIAAAEALLAHDPWREDVLRTAIGLRYEAGDRAGALAEYERFARALHDELGAEPMAETRAVFEAIVRGDAAAGDAQPPDARASSAGGGLPFVGRDTELAALRERWTAAAAGFGGLVLVGGEAGIGKTRLVRELVAECEAQGAQCYAAATTVPETGPYQPFVTLLRTLAPLAASAGVDPIRLSAIAALAPALAEHVADLPELPAVEPGRDRIRLFEACSTVCHAIGARRPLVLVVEDVHWAGASTLAMLEHVARGATGSRVLLIATYREDELELGHRLHALRRGLEREGLVHHLALARLSRAHVEELVGAQLAQRLYEQSDGNPFFLGEIVRELHETGAVSAGLQTILSARLARLSERARALAELAAVIGRSFDVELLRETTGWLEATVLTVLGELVDRRIVAERSVPGEFDFAFTHHLVQALVYDGLAPTPRARRHRRIAHVMTELYAERAGEAAAEIALHWDRGGEPELAAERYLAAARRALALAANDDAAHALARALELSGTRRVRFEALLLRERIAAADGDRALQHALVAELGMLARTIDDEDAICSVLERRIALADVTGERRHERVLLALLRRRIRRSGDVRRHAAWLEAEARYRRAVHDFAAARTAFGELIALSERTGDRGAHANARLALADTYIYEGRLDAAYAELDALRAAVLADGDRGALVRTLIAFSRAALVQQDYAAMSRFAEEAHAVSAAIGDREGEALALHTLANGLVYTFRVDEAEQNYRRALELYERIGHRVGLAGIHVDVGLFRTELGLLDAALELYARGGTIARELGFRFVACVERVNASYCLRLRGEPNAARAAAQAALELAREIRSQHLEPAALGVLGAAELELGEVAASLAHLDAAVELRRPAGATPRLGDNLRALADARLRAGDAGAADRAATELLALYEANPKLAPQPAEWLGAAARVARACGRADDARRLLRQAASVTGARAAAIGDATTRAAYLALPFNRALQQTPV